MISSTFNTISFALRQGAGIIYPYIERVLMSVFGHAYRKSLLQYYWWSLFRFWPRQIAPLCPERGKLPIYFDISISKPIFFNVMYQTLSRQPFLSFGPAYCARSSFVIDAAGCRETAATAGHHGRRPSIGGIRGGVRVRCRACRGRC